MEAVSFAQLGMTLEQLGQHGRIHPRPQLDERRQVPRRYGGVAGESLFARQAIHSRAAFDDCANVLQHLFAVRRPVQHRLGERQGSFGARIVRVNFLRVRQHVAQDAFLDVALHIGEGGLRILQPVAPRLRRQKRDQILILTRGFKDLVVGEHQFAHVVSRIDRVVHVPGRAPAVTVALIDQALRGEIKRRPYVRHAVQHHGRLVRVARVARYAVRRRQRREAL